MGAWGKCASLITNNIGSWARTNAVLMNHYKMAATADKK
jgi:epoxyqueuosine reductase QueG